MEAPTWSIYVTAAVAVYGALLSTWNAWSKHRENRPHIEVKISYGFETHGPVVGPESIMITALNKGRDVTLASAGIRLPDKRNIVFLAPSGSVNFPHSLQSASSGFVSITCRDLAQQIKQLGFSSEIKLAGYYRDALDQEHLSKWFKFDVNHWASSRG